VILLDTHVLLWLISDLEKLSATARKRLLDARSEGEALAISCITLWEIALLTGKNRIEVATTLESLLQELEIHFSVLPITSGTCLRAQEFPPEYPWDPVDRIIGATAVAEGLTLITADRKILASKAVQSLW